MVDLVCPAVVDDDDDDALLSLLLLVVSYDSSVRRPNNRANATVEPVNDATQRGDRAVKLLSSRPWLARGDHR